MLELTQFICIEPLARALVPLRVGGIIFEQIHYKYKEMICKFFHAFSVEKSNKIKGTRLAFKTKYPIIRVLRYAQMVEW